MARTFCSGRMPNVEGWRGLLGGGLMGPRCPTKRPKSRLISGGVTASSIEMRMRVMAVASLVAQTGQMPDSYRRVLPRPHDGQITSEERGQATFRPRMAHSRLTSWRERESTDAMSVTVSRPACLMR